MTDEQLLAKYPPEKVDPLLYTLDRIDWKIMGTLTFAQEIYRANNEDAKISRKHYFNRLIEFLYKSNKTRRRNVCFYRTDEFGKFGEGHLHFLIAKKGLEYIPTDVCADNLVNYWVRELKIGTAVIEPYDKNKGNGVRFCLKREYDKYSRTIRFNEYYISHPLRKLSMSLVS